MTELHNAESAAGYVRAAPNLLMTVDALMSGHDPSSPKPDPEVGESVIDYWLRVIRFQAWEKGYAACVDEGIRTDAENPYLTRPTSPGVQP